MQNGRNLACKEATDCDIDPFHPLVPTTDSGPPVGSAPVSESHLHEPVHWLVFILFLRSSTDNLEPSSNVTDLSEQRAMS